MSSVRESGRAHLVANFQHPPGGTPRRLLLLNCNRQPRKHPATGQVMPLLIRIDDVAIKLRELFLSDGFQELQELRVAPCTHGFARHQGCRDALDRGFERPQVNQQRAGRIERVKVFQADAERDGFFSQQLVVPRFVARMTSQRQLGLEFKRRGYPF